MLEVYDPVAFQETLDWAIEEVNMQLQEEGRVGFELLIESSNGRMFYSLISEDSTREIHYVFVDGYLIVGPNRANLRIAIGHRETGVYAGQRPTLPGIPAGRWNEQCLGSSVSGHGQDSRLAG